MNRRIRGTGGMKKNILYLLVILCLIFSGCEKENAENLIEESATTEETFDTVEETTQEAEKETTLEVVEDLMLEDFDNVLKNFLLDQEYLDSDLVTPIEKIFLASAEETVLATKGWTRDQIRNNADLWSEYSILVQEEVNKQYQTYVNSSK